MTLTYFTVNNDTQFNTSYINKSKYIFSSKNSAIIYSLYLFIKDIKSFLRYVQIYKILDMSQSHINRFFCNKLSIFLNGCNEEYDNSVDPTICNFIDCNADNSIFGRTYFNIYIQKVFIKDPTTINTLSCTVANIQVDDMIQNTIDDIYKLSRNYKRYIHRQLLSLNVGDIMRFNTDFTQQYFNSNCPNNHSCEHDSESEPNLNLLDTNDDNYFQDR